MDSTPVNGDRKQRVARSRHISILDTLKAEPTALVRNLAERLQVSPSTIRRDLDELETQGLVRRVFGGVILENEAQLEPPFALRETLHPQEKDLIGRAAAEMVQNEDIIFIDGGTSTAFMVPYLANKSGLTVITCGLNVAYALSRLKNITSIIVGGEIHAESQAVTGPLALGALEIYNIRCDKAFISAVGVSAREGATNRMLDRIPVKRKAIEISREAILLVDGSKIGTITLGQIAPLRAFRCLITDSTASESELDAIRQCGVQVRVASPKPEEH